MKKISPVSIVEYFLYIIMGITLILFAVTTYVGNNPNISFLGSDLIEKYILPLGGMILVPILIAIISLAALFFSTKTKS